MSYYCYYFIRGATTQFGPMNFPIRVPSTLTIKEVVGLDALTRGIIVCHDWTAEPIDPHEYSRLTS